MCTGSSSERLPAATERAAYLVVVEVLAAAEPGDEVGARDRTSAAQRLTIDIDGVADTGGRSHLQDRVGAVGGTSRSTTGTYGRCCRADS